MPRPDDEEDLRQTQALREHLLGHVVKRIEVRGSRSEVFLEFTSGARLFVNAGPELDLSLQAAYSADDNEEAAD